MTIFMSYFSFEINKLMSLNSQKFAFFVVNIFQNKRNKFLHKNTSLTKNSNYFWHVARCKRRKENWPAKYGRVRIRSKQEKDTDQLHLGTQWMKWTTPNNKTTKDAIQQHRSCSNKMRVNELSLCRQTQVMDCHNLEILQ